VRAVTLSEALDRIQVGARARRGGWHNGLLYIYVPRAGGIAEPFLRYRQGSDTLEQPYPPRRADWFADDWLIVTEEGEPDSSADGKAPAASEPVRPEASDPPTTTDPA